MKLYGFPPSPNTWKVRALAAHLKIKLDEEAVELSQPRTPDYLAINPTGRTPALVDGDFRLWESTAIMQYLASLKPNSIYPGDPRTRADIMRWQSWSIAHWGKEACEPLLFNNLVKRVFNMGRPDADAVAKGTAAFHREAKVLDAHLARQTYLVGNGVTLADFEIATPLFYAEAGQLPVAGYANIRAWFGRVSALPCWQETAPDFAKKAA
jgi:glutathione S-transferase